MSTLYKHNRQFNGSTGRGAMPPTPAPDTAALASGAAGAAGKRPLMKHSGIVCFRCDLELTANEWDGEYLTIEDGTQRDFCSECVAQRDNWDAHLLAPAKPQLSSDQYSQMKRVLYPTHQDIAETAGDPIAQSHDTQARAYWTSVMAGEINPNAVDDPWAPIPIDDDRAEIGYSRLNPDGRYDPVESRELTSPVARGPVTAHIFHFPGDSSGPDYWEVSAEYTEDSHVCLSAVEVDDLWYGHDKPTDADIQEALERHSEFQNEAQAGMWDGVLY